MRGFYQLDPTLENRSRSKIPSPSGIAKIKKKFAPKCNFWILLQQHFVEKVGKDPGDWGRTTSADLPPALLPVSALRGGKEGGGLKIQKKARRPTGATFCGKQSGGVLPPPFCPTIQLGPERENFHNKKRSCLSRQPLITGFSVRNSSRGQYHR